MKKLISLFLSAVLLTAGLAAYGTDEPRQEISDSQSQTVSDSSSKSLGTENQGDSQAAENAEEPAGQEETESGTGNVLVVYYSASGNTRAVANVIAEHTGGAIFEIVPVNEYTDEDLNYTDDKSRVSLEHESLQDALRKNIAIVLQDTVLFSDTVFNNLKYGNEHAGFDEIEAAVKMSRCREMIEMLPQGYDTILRESGSNISQGQRQLLAIARAFVADPQILILDEATSNVDTRTEKAIQDAMHLVMQNWTSIVIAHRLSTIRDADIIVVMDQGRIVECGDHETLLSRKGKYYELYMTQYAGIAT